MRGPGSSYACAGYSRHRHHRRLKAFRSFRSFAISPAETHCCLCSPFHSLILSFRLYLPPCSSPTSIAHSGNPFPLFVQKKKEI